MRWCRRRLLGGGAGARGASLLERGMSVSGGVLTSGSDCSERCGHALSGCCRPVEPSQCRVRTPPTGRPKPLGHRRPLPLPAAPPPPSADCLGRHVPAAWRRHNASRRLLPLLDVQGGVTLGLSAGDDL